MPKYVVPLHLSKLKKIPHWEGKLRAAFEYLGFTDVRVQNTPLAVYFTYWMKSQKALAWHIQRIIKEKFKLDSEVEVKSVPRPTTQT